VTRRRAPAVEGAEVAAIVLAAGASSRMGRPKMLLPVGGRTMLAAVVAPHLEAVNGRVVVVLGRDARRVRAEAGLPVHPRLHVVVNRRWRDGMSSSLRRGLDVCGTADAVLIALGDQPGVTADRVARIVAAWQPGVPLVVPVVSATRAAHPVLFARCLWEELRALRGDVGAREVVRRNWDRAVRVDVAPLLDVDDEEGYRDYLEGRTPAESGLELPETPNRRSRSGRT
jgi:molybdenum cofactor cytidylyltransferase